MVRFRCQRRRHWPFAVALLFATAAPAAELNLFDWMGPAPIVVQGEVVREARRRPELRVSRVFRGDVEPNSRIIVDLWKANRELDQFAEPLKFPEQSSFLLLLSASRRAGPNRTKVFDLVRGVRGAREVPLEGAEALVVAAERLVRIQDSKDEGMTWRQMRRLLEETNPILIATALDHHLKFRRGTLALLPVVRPLLDHPQPGLRERAARMIGGTLSRRGEREVPEQSLLQAELAGRARGDAVVAVRVAATEALDSLPGDGIEELLKEIARADPEQLVRFTAEKLLYQRRAAVPRSSRGP